MGKVIIVAMFPVTEYDIEKYLTEKKQKEILSRIQRALNYNKELVIRDVHLVMNDKISVDEEGYTSSTNLVMGRYCPNEKEIKINKEVVGKKVNEWSNQEYDKFFNREGYLFCDLIFIHECAHAYQDQLCGRIMKKDDQVLEKEANDIVTKVFMKTYECKMEIKEKIITYYNSMVKSCSL